VSAALQRVVVRMLHDPAFAQAVFAGAGLPELTDAERGLLLASDPRAYRTDPYRRSRLLQALIEEFPCATALVSRGGRALDRVDAFLSSPDFHQAVQGRRSVALAWGCWLGVRAPGVAALEHAVARARRWRRPRGPGLALATGVQPVALQVGALARWQHLSARLGPEPLAALVGGAVDLGSPPPLADGHEHWVVVCSPDGQTGLVGGSEGTHAVLDQARTPVPMDRLLAALADADTDEATAREVLQALLEDGLLA